MISITSVTIINTPSFRTMYIRRRWKLKYIIILHIVHHYIPHNEINAKNHKKNISKNEPNLAKKGHFWIFPKNEKNHFLTLMTRLQYKILANSNEQIAIKCKKPPFLGIMGQNRQFGQFLAKMGKTGIFPKSACDILLHLQALTKWKVSESNSRSSTETR